MIANEYINRAIDYILAHVNESISVDDIASHCNFSKHYFSRMFKMETGEGVYEFIKRIRIDQSALRLKIERDKSITDIGFDYGYSPSNFSSLFKQHHDMPPVLFRREIFRKSLVNPIYSNRVALDTFEECAKKISMETHENRLVIYRRYKGNYGDLPAHWDAFINEYSDFITENTLFIERSYDDPSITNTDGCLYDVCMTVTTDNEAEGVAGEGRKVKNNRGEECVVKNVYLLKGGKFAVYHFNGHVTHIYSAYQSIFNVWLPQAGKETDDRYGFDIYRKIDCDTMVMEIDLCILVKD